MAEFDFVQTDASKIYTAIVGGLMDANRCIQGMSGASMPRRWWLSLYRCTTSLTTR